MGRLHLHWDSVFLPRHGCSSDFSIQLCRQDRQDTRFLGQNPRVRNCASEETGPGGILGDGLLTHLKRRDPATGWRVPREPGQYIAFAGLVAFAGLKGLFRGWLSFPGDWFPTRLHIKRSESAKEGGRKREYLWSIQQSKEARASAAADGGGICFPSGQWKPHTATYPKAPRHMTTVTTAAATC